jgi:hypothetical protein
LSVVELSEPYPVGLWIVEDANAAPIGGTFFASLKCSAVTAAVGELPPVRYRCHADPFSAGLQPRGSRQPSSWRGGTGGSPDPTRRGCQLGTATVATVAACLQQMAGVSFMDLEAHC